MATIDYPLPMLEPIKGQKKIPLEELFTSGHRTCQGCESALVMKMVANAAGPRTIVLGMPAERARAGSADAATEMGLEAGMRKGKVRIEPINVPVFGGVGGVVD